MIHLDPLLFIVVLDEIYIALPTPPPIYVKSAHFDEEIIQSFQFPPSAAQFRGNDVYSTVIGPHQKVYCS